MNADSSQLRGDTAASAGPAPKRKRSKKDEDDELPEKKNKACHSCRRVKLRCVVETDGQPCKRCTARGEECTFTTPLHDLKWQETVTARVDHMSETMHYLLGAVQTIAQRLDLQLSAPPTPSQTASSAYCSTSSAGNEPARASRPAGTQSSARAGPSSERNGAGSQAVVALGSLSRERGAAGSETGRSGASTPLRRQGLPEPNFYLTQSGAEELLAQAYAHVPAPSGPLSALELAALQPHPSMDTPAYAGPDAPALFGLLDSYLEGLPSDTSGSTTLNQLQSNASVPEAPGSQDPRPDLVKSGLVPPGDADVLLDFFHAHLAPHLCGFSLKLRSWPYMAQGKAYITPLILTSICLVAAERIPRYHDLRKRIASSALGESVVNATPGLAFAPGQDIASENGLEPDLDLELGIGPEEIVALLVYASFSCSPRSDVVARTAFEWTRGYLKTFMLPSPPPVTYGEVFGLLTARRSLTFENWLRLWLFGYVVDAQQSLHHETRVPVVFDPHFFCDSLLLNTMGSSNLTEQQHDRELVAHARLCSILQRIQQTRLMPAWHATAPQELTATYQRWHEDLEQWWLDQDLGSHASPDLSLVLFRFFARIYVNLAAAQEPKVKNHPLRLEFQSRTVGAAHGLLQAVNEDATAGIIVLLHPFYVKMITLSAVVLLDAFHGEMVAVAPGSLQEAIDMVSQIAGNLSRAPVPSDHVCISASVTLGKIIERAKSVAGPSLLDSRTGP